MATPKSVQELVELARTGDRKAFDELADLYRSRLEHQIQARLGPSVRGKLSVDDVLQETFLRAFSSVRSIRWTGEESFYRWLGSIAEHRIRNAAKKKGWRQLQVDDREALADGTSPSTAMRREERFDRLQTSLDGLDEDQRRAIYLARVEGLPLREIAARLGRSEEAVRKIVARGLLKLREKIGETESLSLPERSLDPEGGRSDAR